MRVPGRTRTGSGYPGSLGTPCTPPPDRVPWPSSDGEASQFISLPVLSEHHLMTTCLVRNAFVESILQGLLRSPRLSASHVSDTSESGRHFPAESMNDPLSWVSQGVFGGLLGAQSFLTTFNVSERCQAKNQGRADGGKRWRVRTRPPTRNLPWEQSILWDAW